MVAAEAFASDDNADFSVQLSACKNANADLVFLPIYYTPASLILAQAKSMEYAPVFFGVDGMDGILALEGFDASLAEGVKLLTPFSAASTDEKTQAFVTKYQEAFGETPNQLPPMPMTASMPCTPPCRTPASPRRPRLRKPAGCVAQFPTLQIDGLTGSLAWESTGEVTKTPNVYTIEGGVYVKME